MPILTAPELTAALARLPHWTIAAGRLTREWTFPTFSDAIRFVNHVAELAELINHHPDIDIRYTHVRLSLISYDVGGLTKRDLRFAERMDSTPT
jgi:4a-hydroxytetrahydrobiopterin dehydratase